jgi:uncharacterized membrane protein HdeD (DUF308 family)
MSWDLILGNLLLMVGIMKLAGYFRGRKSQTLVRLEGLKSKLGAKLGTLSYIAIYVALPITIAVVILFQGYRR